MRSPRGFRSRFRRIGAALVGLTLGCAGTSASLVASRTPDEHVVTPLERDPVDDATIPETPVAPDETVVRVAYAPLPMIGRIAVHTCFLVDRVAAGNRKTERFEVWQSPSGPGEHVLRSDQTGLEYSGVGGDAPWFAHTFRGDEAARLVRVLERSLADYPARHSYLAWPGPNCNTYAAWILREAGVSCELHPRAIGKDYRGLVGAGLTTTGSGLQLENPLLGVRVGLDEGIELHPLGMTFGVDLFPPAIKTPLGRLGFAE